MSKNITSHDVARLARVTQPTVSRALRNLPGVAPETRRRILDAAAALHYVPSESGRILSTQKTHRVAIVSEELTNPYYPELVEPLRRGLAENGYSAVLVTESASDPLTARHLADGSYDGVMLTTVSRSSSVPRDLTELGVPHVLVNRLLDDAESSSCSFDNAAGAETLGAFLVDLGHRRLGMIQGLTSFSTGRDRGAGFRRALERRGVPLHRRDVRRIPYSYDDGFRAALEILQQDDRPTALFCGNDVVALGALGAAWTLGLAVPRDLTIVGFDDIALAGWATVSLTTIHCDLERLGGTAVTLLLDRMADPANRSSVTLPVSLVQRGTHGPPPQTVVSASSPRDGFGS